MFAPILPRPTIPNCIVLTSSVLADTRVALHFVPVQIFRTERKHPLPDIMRSQASTARSSGNVSILGCTPLAAANLSVSSESLEVPDGQPIIDLRAIINCGDDTENDSKLTPMVTNLRQLINSGLVFSSGVFIVEKCKVPEAIGSGAVGGVQR
jgi:hypothetical protein